MLGGTAGGWSGDVRFLNHPIQKVAKRQQIIDGQDNAGSHHGIWIDRAISQQGGRFGAHMRKRQCRQAADDANVEHSIADEFWNVVGIYDGAAVEVDSPSAPLLFA